MSKVLVTESNLHDIADAIRSKNQGSDTYRPGDMAAAILAIPTGSTSTLVSKTITQNGEYDPEDDNADGYSDVTVNVPNSYTAEDEGKVVSSGALVAQTSRSVTENGTYDTTENNEVVVNVSGGGGGGGILHGEDEPTAIIGEDGNIYLKTALVKYVEYLENDSAGSAYIDTGFKPTGNTKVEMVVSHSESIATWFGMWNSAYNSGAFSFTNDRNGIYVGYANNGGTSGSIVDSNQHTVILDKGTASIDNTVVRTYTQSGSFMGNYPLFLFTQNQSGNPITSYTYNRKFRLYGCKIYDNDILIMDMVPVLLGSTPALFDKIGGEVFMNSGSGAFVVGEQQSETTSENITDTYVKVNGTWRGLIGADVNDISVPGLINLQSKTVTENGTVTPDAGYDGLSSVVVNVSGGGGGDTATIAVENRNLITDGVTVNTQPVITDGQIGASASEGMTFGLGVKLYIEFDLIIKPSGSSIILSFGGSNAAGGVYVIDTQRFELYAAGTRFNRAITLAQNVKYRIKLLLEANSATLYVDGTQIAVGQSAYVQNAISYIVTGKNMALLFNQSAHSEYNSSLIDNVVIRIDIK